MFEQLLGGGGGRPSSQLGGLPVMAVVSVPNHYAPMLGETFGGRWVLAGDGQKGCLATERCACGNRVQLGRRPPSAVLLSAHLPAVRSMHDPELEKESMGHFGLGPAHERMDAQVRECATAYTLLLSCRYMAVRPASRAQRAHKQPVLPPAVHYAVRGLSVRRCVPGCAAGTGSPRVSATRAGAGSSACTACAAGGPCMAGLLAHSSRHVAAGLLDAFSERHAIVCATSKPSAAAAPAHANPPGVPSAGVAAVPRGPQRAGPAERQLRGSSAALPAGGGSGTAGETLPLACVMGHQPVLLPPGCVASPRPHCK